MSSIKNVNSNVSRPVESIDDFAFWTSFPKIKVNPTINIIS